MKIFVFGSNGMLGRYVYSFFVLSGFSVFGLTRKDIDIVNIESGKIDEVLSKFDFCTGDIIINCAGMIPQRNNTKKLDFIKVNSVFPHLLQEICEKNNGNLIHISTDCVYDGLKGNYSELDDYNVNTLYGVTKFLGEPENATTIRTSIIGEEIQNFVSLIEWVKSQKGKEVKGFTNHFWNGITCLQFAKICKNIIEEKNFWQGVKHINSPEKLSKYELVKLISIIYKLNITVNPYTTNKKCDRSLSSIRDEIDITIPELKQQLIELKGFMLLLT